MPEITRAGAIEAMGAAAIVHSSLPNSMAAALDALLAYLKANGWTPPMPMEATAEMLVAADAVRSKGGPGHVLVKRLMLRHDLYAAMCSAAPNPLVEETRDER